MFTSGYFLKTLGKIKKIEITHNKGKILSIFCQYSSYWEENFRDLKSGQFRKSPENESGRTLRMLERGGCYFVSMITMFLSSSSR